MAVAKDKPRLMMVVTIWTNICLSSSGKSLQLRPIGETGDVLSKAQDAIISVLKESWRPSCSFAFITNGVAPANALFKITSSLQTETNPSAFFEVSSSENEENATTFQPPNFLFSVDSIRRMSRCLTAVVASDDGAFLTSSMGRLVNDHILIWPSRLLVVTRLQQPSSSSSPLRSLSDVFSNSNSMLMVLEETPVTKRCGIYLNLPFNRGTIHIASWTPSFGLRFFGNHRLFPDKFLRLSNGAHLVLTGQNFPPHAVSRMIVTTDGEEKILFTGPVRKLANMLAKQINFTYTLLQPLDWSWGILLPDGSWNGMVGLVMRKEADIGLGPFAITYSRSRVVDYTNPLAVDYLHIMGGRGDTQVDPWGFLVALTPLVWVLVFIAMIVVILSVVCLSKFDMNLTSASSRISVSTYIRVLLQQDIIKSVQSRWEHLILGCWLLSVFVVIASYKTNLMSLLAVRYISEPYQTIRNVLNKSSLNMIWQANTAHIQFLSEVKEGIFREVAEAGERGRIELITPKNASVVDELVSLGDHVLVTLHLLIKRYLTEDYMDRGKCKFYVSREGFLPLTFCLVVGKHSPLRGAVNEVLRAVTEGGLYEYWLENAIPNVRSCRNPPTKITVKASLSLTNVWVMFIVLLFGYAVSFLALGVEVGSSILFQ